MKQPTAQLQTRRELVAAQLEALPKANKRKADGSAYFKCVGGAYHDITVRMYPPWTDLVHPVTGDVYQYSSEPIKRGSKQHIYQWVGNK